MSVAKPFGLWCSVPAAAADLRLILPLGETEAAPQLFALALWHLGSRGGSFSGMQAWAEPQKLPPWGPGAWGTPFPHASWATDTA